VIFNQEDEDDQLVIMWLMASGINIYSSFQISNKFILDIQNNNFGYPELDQYFGYPK